jgi:glycosyltransferase involved in cell wall biosynthesis
LSSGDSPGSKRPTVVLSTNSGFNLLHFRGALLTGLQHAGYRVVAVAPRDGHTLEFANWGIEFAPVRMARSGLNPLGDLRLLSDYLRVLRRLRPAVYCSFTIKPNVYGSIAARLCGVPSIANVTGLGTAFLAKGALWRLTRSMYRAAFKRSHAVYFHNGDDLRAFVEGGIVKPAQARVIAGSGIDLDHYRPAEFPAGAPVFLFIGRLLRDKGVREFVEAARLVKAHFPHARFQLLGDIDLGNRTSVTATELRSWVDEGVVEHLQEQQDVRPFISAATAVVLPSYREGMSRALLEAAAMARPLVGSDVPGVRELAEEGVTGARFAPRDSGSLAKAMERIAEASPETLRRYGANAREKVEREFSEESVVKTYLNAIGELVPRAD